MALWIGIELRLRALFGSLIFLAVGCLGKSQSATPCHKERAVSWRTSLKGKINGRFKFVAEVDGVPLAGGRESDSDFLLPLIILAVETGMRAWEMLNLR